MSELAIAYVVYPKDTFDESKLSHEFNAGSKDDIWIWIRGWYMEDCDVFKIEYSEDDLIEIVDGTVQLDTLEIINARWLRLRGYRTIERIGEEKYEVFKDSQRDDAERKNGEKER